MTDQRPDYSLPLPVQRTLRKLGQDIHDARLRRRIPAAVLAERASISRSTLHKIEKGDRGVSVGIVATVLFALRMNERLADVADIRHDHLGLTLDQERLPQRVRRRRRPATKTMG